MRTTESTLRRLDASGVPLLIARLVLGGLFIYMGIAKLMDPVAFLKVVRQYQMLPESPAFFLNSTAIVLPWLEVITGTAMIVGLYTRGAAAILVVMLAVFTPAILMRTLASMAESGTPFFQVKFDCGCGGGEVIIWRKLMENAGLFVLAIYALFSGSRRFSLDLWLARRSASSGWCHLCGYSVRNPVAGLCEKCATPPTIPSAEMAR
jgi:uncharacterized membrane protein YphA (DoxX/SURF4 family)